MIILAIISAIIGWLIGANLVWWAQIVTFVAVWSSIAIKTRGSGLEGIFVIVCGIIITCVTLLADVIYVLKYPSSMHWLKTVGGWFAI